MAANWRQLSCIFLIFCRGCRLYASHHGVTIIVGTVDTLALIDELDALLISVIVKLLPRVIIRHYFQFRKLMLVIALENLAALVGASV